MVDKEHFEHLIGLTIDQARENLGKDYTIRRTKVDGKNMIGTCDFRIDRINVWIENDIIIKIQGIG